MDNLEISEMKVIPCTNSPYIQPARVIFKQVDDILVSRGLKIIIGSKNVL